MPAQKYRIDDPAFNEFVYSILYNASSETKLALPARYRKLVRYEKEARKFIKRANTDEARTLLSYLGIENFMVFVAKDMVNLKSLKDILDKCIEGKKIQSLQDIIDQKLFVTSDKELITLLGLVSQSIHHRSYTMNLELINTGYHVYKWKKQFSKAPANEIQENSNLLAKTLLSSSVTLPKVDFLFNIRPLDMQLLLYLYPLKHCYTSIAQIFDFFQVAGHKSKIAAAVKQLVKAQFIQKSAIAKQNEYTITAMGIQVVNRYMEAVLHSNCFM